MLKTKAIIISVLLTPLFGFAAGQSVLDVDKSLDPNTLVMPESFETGAQRLRHNWFLQNYATVDSLADYRDDIQFSEDVFIDRLSKIPAVIELPYNSLVKNSITFYTNRRRSQVSNMIGLSHYYFPIFEQALEKYGLPNELKYLAVIESALDPNAVSKAGAAGLWQFMTPTAKGLNLEVNSLVDERRDPLKSSEKAAQYLKELYSIYNDWSLAIAAYNCGMGNVNKALRRISNNSTPDFWTIYPFLPSETRGYVPAFIAACYVMNYYNCHNITPALIRRPLITDSVMVNKRVHFQQIANVLQIPIEEIRLLNPQYRKDVIPGDIHPYSLILPTQQIAAYIMSEDSIVANEAEKYTRRYKVEPSDGAQVNISEDGDYIVTEKTYYHKVKKGETLTSIAKKYGVTVSSIRQANGGIKSVKRGRTIKIMVVTREKRPKTEYEVRADSVNIPDNNNDIEQSPDSISSPDTPQTGDEPIVEQKKPVEKKKTTPKTDNTKPVYVTVRKGDSLSKIAQRNGTTVKKIKALNNMKSDRIQAGQKLRVK